MRGGLCFICTNVFSFCMLRSGSLKRNIYFYLQASKEILMKSRSVKIYRRHAYTTRYFKRVKAVRTTQSFAKMQHVGYICIIDEANIKQIFIISFLFHSIHLCKDHFSVTCLRLTALVWSKKTQQSHNSGIILQTSRFVEPTFTCVHVKGCLFNILEQCQYGLMTLREHTYNMSILPVMVVGM